MNLQSISQTTTKSIPFFIKSHISGKSFLYFQTSKSDSMLSNLLSIASKLFPETEMLSIYVLNNTGELLAIRNLPFLFPHLHTLDLETENATQAHLQPLLPLKIRELHAPFRYISTAHFPHRLAAFYFQTSSS